MYKCYLVLPIVTLVIAFSHVLSLNADVCQLENDRGPCTDYTVKWYYSEEDGKCDRFWYGGCEGNQNRFDNEDDCINHCKNGIAAQTGCKASRYGCCRDGITPATGPQYQGCPERQPTGCKASRYGCCRDGITNATGPQYLGCPERQPTGCKASRYGCCRDGITTATGPQYQGCPETKPAGPKCQQKSDVGTCSDYKVLWFYNSEAGKCDRFWYGGCGGNDNRFASEDDCKVACQQGSEVVREEYKPGQCPSMSAGEEDDCSVTCNSDYDCSGSQKCCVNGCSRTCVEPQATEPETREKPGQCPVLPLGRIGVCVESCSNDYSCDGAQKCCSNGCGHTCQDPADDQNGPGRTDVAEPVCALGKERGPCTDYSVKWYYDTGLGKCQRFWYGGCEGNGNKFETQDDCIGTCSSPTKPEDVCNLPSVTGRCRASLKRWHFDSRIQECRPFTYGGCGGNSNRFRTRAECEKKCSKSATSERITNFHAEKITSYEIMLAWEAPKQNQVENYKLEYMGVKYYRDNTKQDPLREVILSGTSTSYMMDNLMDAAEYTINIMPMFKEGSNGPKEKLVATTKIAETVLCSNSAYGCCPDGVTSADGPDNKGCADACQASEFGCCDDGETAAAGPNMEGCDLGSGDDDNFCEQSVFGCCPDGSTPAQGANMEGCGIDISNTRDMKCTVKPDIGRVCSDYTARWFYNSNVGRCDRFWYGGCDGNKNNYETEALCAEACGNTGVTAKPAVSIPVCEQPKVVGPCRAALPRYYYNGQNCEEFMYGGCQGNENNFQTEAECERRCSNDIDIDNVDGTIGTCQQTMDTGPCLEHHPRWYYDASRKDCVEFDYGGCEGNDNNFPDRESCLRKCGAGGIDKPLDKEDVDICRLVSNEGKFCTSDVTTSVQRWFYDYNDGVCKQFTFKGCDGNKNNFATQNECEYVCSRESVCKTFVYPPIQCLAYFRRYKFNPESRDCSEFIYGGCGGNSNNFATLESCLSKCAPERLVKTVAPTAAPPSSWKDICNMRADPGPCKAYVEKYYHNKDTYKCEKFVYGGCGGNQNQFDSIEKCESYCGESESIVVDPTGSGEIDDAYCRLRKESGNCVDSIPAWYYDYQTGTCQQFEYSGCGGNENRFTSKDTCETSCKTESMTTAAPVYTASPVSTASPVYTDRSVCFLPLAAGNCQDYTAMYYYDQTIKDCKPFWYTGCDGNENRFATGEECREKCWSGDNVIRPVYTPSPPQTTTTGVVITDYDVCNEKSELGGCTDYVVKWHYDNEEQRCKRFWYGGCDGNANNFDDENQCQETCVYRVRPQPGTTQSPVVDDCRRTRFGCCPDQKTPAIDRYFSNCDIQTNDRDSDKLVNGAYINVVEPPGRDVTIDCLAFKDRNYDGSVSWYKDGFLITVGRRYTITTDGALIISNSVSDDSGIYACRITSDMADPFVQRYRLQIEEAVGIYPTPPKIIVRPGDTAFLNCQAFGKPKPTVYWTRGGQPLPRDSRYETSSDGTLKISGTMENDVGIYLCVADNRISSPVQKSITLELRDSLRAEIDPVNGRLREGERLYLRCVGYGYPVPAIQWERSGRPLTSDQRISVTGGNLRVANVALEDTGLYKCILRNDEEKVEASVSIQVIPRDVKPENCADTSSPVKCRLIVRARLCGYSIYSKQCCNSCEQELQRLRGRK